MGVKRLVHLLYVVPILFGLFALDGWISHDHTSGMRRAYIRRYEKRLKKRPKARVAIVGQSTVGQWLGRSNRLAKVLGRRGGDVVDAHIGSCHVGCTLAQVRKMIDEGRHFEQVYFGLNLFSMCEMLDPGRVLTHVALTPPEHVFDLLRIYSHAEKPFRYYAQAAGIVISGAYGTADGTRQHFQQFLGMPKPPPRKRQHEWALRKRKVAGWTPTCDYAPNHVALKTAFYEALLEELPKLGDRAFVLALPDRGLASAEQRTASKPLLAHLKARASAAPGVQMVDLISKRTVHRHMFRDAAHLGPRGDRDLARVLKKKLKGLGAL